MNNILRDLRYGLRTLTRNPGFAAVAVLTIGIGIGASTTIFSWMRSMLLNPLPGAAQAVVVISHSYWKSQYHSDRSAVGASLRINRTPFTIIGVAPEGFHGTRSGLDYEMWMPLTMYGQLTHTGTWMLRDRNTRNFIMYGRLAPGVTMEQARSEVQALANRMAVADADSNQGIGATVLPVWQAHFGTQSILLTPITILMGASGVVLLIVCANLANLLLARATGRLKEFSVRLAMGARPARLTRQLLTETLLMAVAGSV